MMQHAEREIRDRELIKAILDLCNVINIGMFDGEYPYVLPCNFGYTFDDNLVFYTHHALKGYKLGLIEKNPKVCVVTHVFVDNIVNTYDNTKHDYRSVMAFGEMEELQPGTDDYRTALKKLLECNGRPAPEAFVNSDQSKSMRMFKIICRPENVMGKAQREITQMNQIPLPTPAEQAK
jgi:nitroimidazol reductase NimA-like FMN-containing flavoprotein (pyridoxamine 5'-phosphate oxidase superfamily)